MSFKNQNNIYTNDSNDKLKEKIGLFIWKFIKYFVVAINLIAAISSIGGFIISLANDDIKSMFIYIVLCIVAVSMIFAIIVAIRSEQNDKMKEAKKYSQGFHDILHLIRDCYGDLMGVTENETYKRPFDFRKYMTENVMKITNILSDNLTEATHNKVRACVKVFDFIENEETDKDKMKLITLARSGISNVNNMISEHHMHIMLNENTDFEYIFDIKEGYNEERKHFFISDDLIKLYNKGKYKNSNNKWKELYRTTIVMPIRFLINPEEDNNTEKSYYDIIGYLCIDSKKKNLFSIKNRGFIIEYLEGIADILYVYLNECTLYHDYLKTGGC